MPLRDAVPRREVVILVGLQAAGKSSFYRSRFALTHAHVSKDAFPNSRDKDGRQQELVRAALASGRSVVVDNTNPAASDRAPLVAIARAHGARVVVYFFPPDPGESL
ncbi:MAG TPA: AAA family ATPase, partial [Deinococcales bacterium]|nr:AAA family ATPase [Deinococcales bacterium]